MFSMSTEVSLTRIESQGLRKALLNEQKHRNRKRPLLLDLPTENKGGAIFFSPHKVQQARDLQYQKDEEALREQASKNEKKLQQQLAKESRELEKLQRAQIREEKRKQREQAIEEKQRLKAERELTKQADLQLHNEVLATPRPSKKRIKQISRQAKQTRGSTAHEEIDKVVTATNRRGRPIRLPVRYR